MNSKTFTLSKNIILTALLQVKVRRFGEYSVTEDEYKFMSKLIRRKLAYGGVHFVFDNNFSRELFVIEDGYYTMNQNRSIDLNILTENYSMPYLDDIKFHSLIFDDQFNCDYINKYRNRKKNHQNFKKKVLSLITINNEKNI